MWLGTSIESDEYVRRGDALRATPSAVVADLDVPFARPAPQDIAAEQGVLGGMLLAKDVIAEVMEILKSQDFYRPVHASIFDTILELHGRGEPADALTVAGVLADSGELQRVGGVPYLHTLIESVPTAANATYYARIVADQAVLRSLDEACVKIRQMIHSRSVPPSEFVETARTMVADLAGGIASTDGPVRWADVITPGPDAVEEFAEARGTAAGIPTGFVDLDRLIGGIQPGKVYVIAGGSGSGKSTLASDWVRSAAFTHQQGTVVFNLEMSSLELFNRDRTCRVRSRSPGSPASSSSSRRSCRSLWWWSRRSTEGRSSAPTNVPRSMTCGSLRRSATTRTR